MEESNGVEQKISKSDKRWRVEAIRQEEDLELCRSDGCRNGPNPNYPLNPLVSMSCCLVIMKEQNSISK